MRFEKKLNKHIVKDTVTTNKALLLMKYYIHILKNKKYLNGEFKHKQKRIIKKSLSLKKIKLQNETKGPLKKKKKKKKIYFWQKLYKKKLRKKANQNKRRRKKRLLFKKQLKRRLKHGLFFSLIKRSLFFKKSILPRFLKKRSLIKRKYKYLFIQAKLLNKYKQNIFTHKKFQYVRFFTQVFKKPLTGHFYVRYKKKRFKFRKKRLWLFAPANTKKYSLKFVHGKRIVPKWKKRQRFNFLKNL